jgi:hypothetical protein
VDDLARVGVQQDQARRRDLERQPEQRREQQQRRERRDLQRVIETSDAMDLEKGVFTKRSPRAIALYRRASNTDRDGRRRRGLRDQRRDGVRGRTLRESTTTCMRARPRT